MINLMVRRQIPAFGAFDNLDHHCPDIYIYIDIYVYMKEIIDDIGIAFRWHAMKLDLIVRQRRSSCLFCHHVIC